MGYILFQLRDDGSVCDSWYDEQGRRQKRETLEEILWEVAATWSAIYEKQGLGKDEIKNLGPLLDFYQDSKVHVNYYVIGGAMRYFVKDPATAKVVAEAVKNHESIETVTEKFKLQKTEDVDWLAIPGLIKKATKTTITIDSLDPLELMEMKS